MGKIRFNIQTTIQKECELDLADSEKVIRRAEEIKIRCRVEKNPINFYYECAIQELLDENEIVGQLVEENYDSDITSAWVKYEEN